MLRRCEVKAVDIDGVSVANTAPTSLYGYVVAGVAVTEMADRVFCPTSCGFQLWIQLF